MMTTIGIGCDHVGVADWIEQNWGKNKPKVGLSEQNGVWLGQQGSPGYNVLSKLPAGTPILSNVYPYWGNLTVAQAVDALMSRPLKRES